MLWKLPHGWMLWRRHYGQGSCLEAPRVDRCRLQFSCIGGASRPLLQDAPVIAFHSSAAAGSEIRGSGWVRLNKSQL